MRINLSRSWAARLAFVFIAIVMPLYSGSAQDEISFDREDCPIKIGHSLFDYTDGFTCKQTKLQHAKSSWMVGNAPNHFVLALNDKVNAGMYVRFTGQAKTDTKKFLSNFPYVKDNWRDIRTLNRKNKTALLASGEKVILYRIRLDKADNCLGFSKGKGGNVPLNGGGIGTKAMIALLACDLTGTEDIDTLVEIIEEMTFEKLR